MPFYRAGETEKTVGMDRERAIRKKMVNRRTKKLRFRKPVEMPAPRLSRRSPLIARRLTCCSCIVLIQDSSCSAGPAVLHLSAAVTALSFNLSLSALNRQGDPNVEKKLFQDWFGLPCHL
jgi:hypothetical protein